MADQNRPTDRQYLSMLTKCVAKDALRRKLNKRGGNVKLERLANAKLAKAGFFEPRQETGALPAECITSAGLVPTWHGRA